MSLPHTFPHKHMNDLMVKAELKFPSLVGSKVGTRIRCCGSQRPGSCSLVRVM